MLRIQRFASEGCVLFTLSGRIETANVTELWSLVAAESMPILFDLKEVSLVSREVVQFLAQCQDTGIIIQNCPAYIREWIARESANPNPS
jgi:hypothetical protein